MIDHIIQGAIDEAIKLHKYCSDEIEFRTMEAVKAANVGNEKFFTYCMGKKDAMHELAKQLEVFIERLQKRVEILKAVDEAKEKGLYDANEHFTSSIDLEDTK
jgi:hypothetical protein